MAALRRNWSSANVARTALLGSVIFFVILGTATAESPSLILSVANEIGLPGAQVTTSVRLQNLTDEVFAFQLSMHVDREDLVHFPGQLMIGSCLECADEACTSTVVIPCTSYVATVITANTLVENWSYVQARVIADTQIRVTAISDLWGTGTIPPIAPNTEGILVKLVAEVVCEVPDTLINRTAEYAFDSSLTFFSNVIAELIDSTMLGTGAITVGIPNRGDMNADGFHNAEDINLLIQTMFFNGPKGCPAYVSDVNCDGLVDAMDLNYVISLLFFNGPMPPC